MTTTQTFINELNGVNVEALLGARAALEEMPVAGEFTWKATSEWKGGVHTKTTIGNFFGLGEEQDRGKTFNVESDHPAAFAAPDAAPTPVELVLAGLAGCLTGGIASVAENRGIKLHSVKATVEGDMHLHGIMGVDANVRNGFSAIRVKYDIEADANLDDLKAVVAQSQKRSAVFDMLVNPSNVFVTVE